MLQPGTASAEKGHTAIKEGGFGRERPDLAPKELLAIPHISCLHLLHSVSIACVFCYGDKSDKLD